MTENAKTPVVGYVRCSTDKQGYSILDQKKAITEFANRLGYEITEWFADEGKSGVGMEHRRALVRMLELVGREQADFKYILVYDVSRWGRYGDPDEAAYWEYHCKRCGVEVLYVSENFPEDNRMATAMLKMMKRVEAGEYSRKLSHLSTRGSRTAAEHGFWNGATAPYGYKRLLVDDKGNPIAPPAGASVPGVPGVNRSGAGLVIEDNPNDPGGKIIRLNGQMRSNSVAQEGADGSIQVIPGGGIFDSETARKMQEANAKRLQENGKED